MQTLGYWKFKAQPLVQIIPRPAQPVLFGMEFLAGGKLHFDALIKETGKRKIPEDLPRLHFLQLTL